MIQVNEKEVYRYLGYRNQIPDASILAQIQSCMEQMQQCTPKFVMKEFDLKQCGEDLYFSSVHIHSKYLSKNLKGCEKIVCLATTLGIVPDRLIARANIQNKAQSVILQALGCAMIEAYTDLINEQIKADAQQRGYRCRPRYSCGYGDCALAHQRDFIRILDMPKTIGVTLTQGDLMVPYKSVTAMIGLTREVNQDLVGSCQQCEKTDCMYRKVVKV